MFTPPLAIGSWEGLGVFLDFANRTLQWEIHGNPLQMEVLMIFNGKITYKWGPSIAMFDRGGYAICRDSSVQRPILQISEVLSMFCMGSFHITCASFRTCQGNLVTGHCCADPKEPKFAGNPACECLQGLRVCWWSSCILHRRVGNASVLQW